MAKREFIEKSALLDCTSKNLFCECDVCLNAELCSFINEKHTFTEQEIVKSYLEKLKAKIESYYDGTIPMYRIDAVGVIKLIDNLLSESEAENDGESKEAD